MPSPPTDDLPAWKITPPTGRRCPSIDAAAIYAVSQGELDLNRTPQVTADPHFVAKPQVARLESETSGCEALAAYQPKQPNRLLFDAADIYELSRVAHPWLAKAIEKAACDEPAVQKAG